MLVYSLHIKSELHRAMPHNMLTFFNFHQFTTVNTRKLFNSVLSSVVSPNHNMQNVSKMMLTHSHPHPTPLLPQCSITLTDYTQQSWPAKCISNQTEIHPETKFCYCAPKPMLKSCQKSYCLLFLIKNNNKQTNKQKTDLKKSFKNK